MSSFFGGSSSSSSPAAPNSSEEMKTAIMKQLQAEAAMTNARALIGVCLPSLPSLLSALNSLQFSPPLN